MNSEITENVQKSIRPGAMVDTYYYGETNSECQAYPCVVNNKFVQDFTNKTAGTSQFTISPYQGVSDVVVQFQMPSSTDFTGYSLPQGWGYGLINRVSVRYGSSSQYYFTGAQIYLQNLHDCENPTKRDSLSLLGGNALVGNAAQGAFAYLYINLPHNSPRADGKPLPFPSDLLVQPIIITVELNNISSVFLTTVGSTPAALPSNLSLDVAQLQVRQEMMSDTADLLARREDLNTHAYTFPLKFFPQQETSINLQSSANAQNVNLTGFRAGEVQRILLWLTKGSGNAVNGPLVWYPMSNVLLTYNGEIFWRSDNGCAQLWDLVSDTKEAAVNAQAQNGSGVWNPTLSTWVDIPFSQVNVPYDKEIKLCAGKPILNAVVNLQVQTPTAASDYVLHALYLYNASLLCSRGSSEYVF